MVVLVTELPGDSDRAGQEHLLQCMLSGRF